MSKSLRKEKTYTFTTKTDLIQYRREIYEFLSTLTVKFEYFAALENKKQIDKGLPVNFTDKSTWSYYQNLIGNYHPSNRPMEVTSLDTSETVIFSKDIKLTHPITFRAYRQGTTEYKYLCGIYPDQINLIKSIVYPVESIDKAIDAKNFTIFYCDPMKLHINESDDLVHYTQQILWFMYDRYYMEQAYYEELYPLSFWSLSFYVLIEALFSRRICNMHTQEVHPFHIWEYITSKGLENYSSILTNEQALWLYRNINYIIRHAGKNHTLRILADNLLKPLKLTLVNKRIVHTTDMELLSVRNNANWHAEIEDSVISDFADVKSKDKKNTNIESIQMLHNRLVQLKLDKNNDTRYVQQIQDSFDYTKHSELLTKYIELKRNVSNSEYEELLIKFTFDTFIHLYISGKLNYKLTFLDPNSGNTISGLDVSTSIALIYYVSLRTVNIIPDKLPTIYNNKRRYLHFTPDEANAYPTKFYYNNKECDIHDWLDKDYIQSTYRSDTVLDSVEFINYIGKQFVHLLDHLIVLRQSAVPEVHKAFEYLYDYWCPETIDVLNLSGVDNYKDFFNIHSELKTLISNAEETGEGTEAFCNLYKTIMAAMFPFDKNNVLIQYIGNIHKLSNAFYDGIKQLFIQLCSYNVAFLDTDSASVMFTWLSKFTLGIDSSYLPGDDTGPTPSPDDPNNGTWNTGGIVPVYPSIHVLDWKDAFDSILDVKLDDTHTYLTLGTLSDTTYPKEDESILFHETIKEDTMYIPIQTTVDVFSIMSEDNLNQFDRTNILIDKE